MKTLRLRLCPLAELGPDSVLEYELLGNQREVLRRDRAVPAALPRLPRTELVVAAPDVLLVEAAVPPLSGSRLRAALRALAEPHLLSAMETAHVVAGKMSAKAGGRSVLAVLDRVLFGRALELFARLKIVPAAATPEQLTLPLRPGSWTLKLGPSYGCLRTGELTGIACSLPEGDAQPVEVRLALDQAGGAKAIDIVKEEQRAEPVRLELLQYEFAPRMADWRAWRAPVALAAALALTWIIGLNVQAWLMVREESALRSQMEGAFREAFPRVPVVLDPLKQMRRGVAELRSGAGAADPRDFLPLASGLARALPAEADVVRTLEFRDQVLRVEFDPRALDAARRDQLLRSLAAAGLSGAFAENTLTLRAKGEGS
jgi:general secretion pathway protein L